MTKYPHFLRNTSDASPTKQCGEAIEQLRPIEPNEITTTDILPNESAPNEATSNETTPTED
jgi:hypothetical protein